MAQSLLTFLLIAIATLQVVFATSYYCDPPHRPRYGDYGPHHGKYRVGYSIRYHCDDGYYHSGSLTSKCIYSSYYRKASWSHKAPICKRSYYKPKPKYCPKLKLPYGYVKHWGYSYGKKAVHYCDKCYKLYGDRVRVCKYGYWSGKKPVCKPIYCDKPPKLYYGKVSYKGKKCGDKAWYSCDYGWYLKGDKVLVCKPNGYWYGKVPKCVRRIHSYKY